MKMKFLKQENTFYNENIRRYGCYFLVILRIIEEVKNLEFDHEEVENFYREFVSQGFMRANCYVTDPDGIFRYFGQRVKVSKREITYKPVPGDLNYVATKIQLNPFHFYLSKFNKRGRLEKFWDSLFLVNNNHRYATLPLRVFCLV